MTPEDFKGYRLPILAHAFDLKRGLGVDVHLRAGTYQEALDRLERKLQCQQSFLRATGGQYQVRFELIIPHRQRRHGLALVLDLDRV